MFGKNSSGENNVTGATVESITWTMYPVGKGSIVELSTGIIAALLQLGKRQPRPRTLRDWNLERSQTSLLLEAHLNN